MKNNILLSISRINTIYCAKLLTNHPEGTYELQKDNEGYLTLVITNPDSFWSLSRYLVVELN